MKIKYLGEGNEAVMLNGCLVSLNKEQVLEVSETDAEYLLKDNSRYALETVAFEDVKAKSKSLRRN